MITVYFDASYNQASRSQPEPRLFYTVGCYMGEVDSWRKFRKEWRVELDRRGISDFHMNKFERARSEVISGRELKPDNPYSSERGFASEDP